METVIELISFGIGDSLELTVIHRCQERLPPVLDG